MLDVNARYLEYVSALERRGVFPDREPSLDSMHEGLRRLALKIDPERVVVVAGTNGKGSTCAALEALLISAGQRVGFYSSPHLVQTTERFRIDGRDIERGVFCQAYEAVAAIEAGLKITHFEFLTLMSVWIFHSGAAVAPVDWAVYEVGLGGTWDATNAIPHRHGVIAQLALDHEKFLGNDLVSVARNKFGIVTTEATVTHAPFPSDGVAQLAQEIRARTKSTWRLAPAARWRPYSEDRSLESLTKPAHVDLAWGAARSALPGQRAANNLSLACATFESLGFTVAPHLPALASVRWGGRFEVTRSPRGHVVALSGDHNVSGVDSLLEILERCGPRKIRALVGLSADKDMDGILSRLFRVPGLRVHLTQSPFKGRAIRDFGAWRERAESAVEKPEEAFHELLALADPHEEFCLVTGSLYLVGTIKAVTDSWPQSSSSS